MKRDFMEGEKNKFSVLSEIFSQFTEENMNGLLKTAKQLLETQQEDVVKEFPTKGVPPTTQWLRQRHS